MTTSITEAELFQRQRSLVGDGQEKIRSLRVLVVGAGGLGCPALQYLATAGVGHLGIVDHDVVSVSNLHRQILFSVDDVGKPKALVARTKLERLAPFTEITAYSEVFNEKNTETLETYDIILDCTDNFHSKFLLHDECFRRRKVLIQAAVYQVEGQLNVFDFRTSSGPCWRCLWGTAPEDGCTGTCAEVGVLGPLLGALGSLQAMEALKVALEEPFLKNGEGIFLDLRHLSLSRRRWGQRPGCGSCAGAHAPVQTSLQVSLPANLSEYSIIDVRESHEHRTCPKVRSLPDVIHLPLGELPSFSGAPGSKYLLVCASGARSLKGVKLLRSKGLEAYSLIAGL